ncbi:hypothetical protein EJ08DRAFT_298921 [Tothia fuscella]|uniref:DBF4-type domain-containing protein n=1 Tax=Tothia fuscella TaxID=1048955 RepID=A0A9P4NNU9_9PEZI|nr:hypothetical protein EJ08DRAFT_298921 [Tothia fuscella]
MAAVSLLPSPTIQTHTTMTSRRVPLGNLPNATNSPFRGASTAAPGTKRARQDTNSNSYAQPPPAKKQMLDPTDDVENRRHAPLLRKAGLNPPPAPTGNALRSKFEAVAREGRQNSRASQTSKQSVSTTTTTTTDNLESIRQWQLHYKKVFPNIVFYYESIPDDVRQKISRQVQALGSREEVFFSKTVTHVVTTRNIPPELTSSSSSGRSPNPRNNAHSTINPLLLETQQARGKFTFEASLPKRGQATMQDVQPNNILYKAREMGMKIWSLEKLNRMLITMFNNATGESPQLTQSRPSTASRDPRGADLSQLLQKEKQYGQTAQDWQVDMAPFRGCYIYIHDMEEKTRPVMIRDYPKPQSKELGKWPQLRANGPGRCPFLNDPAYKEQVERPPPEQAPRTRAAAAAMQSREVPEKHPLAENNNLARRQRAASAQGDDHVKPLDPPKQIPIKRGTSTDNLPLFGSAQASLRNHPRFAGGEPVASGVQPSNITSAIHSRAISSTAAAPGAKAGQTKEMNRLLGRRVLENKGGLSNANVTSAQLNDLRGAINGGGASRGAKRKATDLAHILEDREDEEVLVEDERQIRVVQQVRKKKAVEKELKPGYCENCRVKFNDFDEHVVSKQHRKFATSAENWVELDDLLDQLKRERKDEEVR